MIVMTDQARKSCVQPHPNFMMPAPNTPHACALTHARLPHAHTQHAHATCTYTGGGRGDGNDGPEGTQRGQSTQHTRTHTHTFSPPSRPVPRLFIPDIPLQMELTEEDAPPKPPPAEARSSAARAATGAGLPRGAEAA